MAVLGSPLPYSQLWDFIIISFLIFWYLILDCTIGTYGLLDKEKKVLSRTDYFFYTKKLNVKDIHTIYYRPTWIIGGIARSLYIIGNVDGKEKVIEFPNVGWYEKVLVQIVTDLKQMNPSIQLDEPTEALLKKNESKN